MFACLLPRLADAVEVFCGASVAVLAAALGSASFVPLPVLIPLLLLLLPVLLVPELTELLLELELLLLELLLLLSLSFRLVEGALAAATAVGWAGGTVALVFIMFTDAFLAASRCGTTRKSAMNSFLACLSCFFRPEVVVVVVGSLLGLLDDA